jgi:hypothetical protein
LISISAELKISCDGCLFLLAAFITHTHKHSLEKIEMRRTTVTGRGIIMVEISAR